MTHIEYLLLAPVSLFVIIAPVSAAPLFLVMTPDNTPPERIAMARLACMTGSGVLLTFSILGEFILKTMGITMPAFQVAGGILLFLIALDMLQAKESARKITNEESQAGTAKDDIAVTPLAVPLLVGPGAISTGILLNNQAGGFLQHGMLYISIILVMVAAFFVLRIASYGAKWLSPLVLRISQRLMGLLLAALAIQFVFNGLSAFGLLELESAS